VYVNDVTEVGGEARVVTYTKKKIDDWKQKVAYASQTTTLAS
jgi:hypothetical protein